jgi:hypothetical protein
MDFRIVIGGLIFSIAGYALWRGGARAHSLIRATATSKIGTAAKGYAELNGKARAATDAPLRDPITDHPCLWFSIVTEKFSYLDKMRWRRVKSATSSRPFVLDDGTGKCLIRPEDASIDTRTPCIIVKERHNLRHKVWWIRDGDPLYAIGHLERISPLAVATIFRPGPAPGSEPAPDNDEQALTSQATAVLRTWKKDQATLLAEFDADGDGRIDAAEWEAARTAARAQAAEAMAVRAERAPEPLSSTPWLDEITHKLSGAPDGRPLLVTTHGERSLARSNRANSWIGMVMFVVGVIMLLSFLAQCAGGP